MALLRNKLSDNTLSANTNYAGSSFGGILLIEIVNAMEYMSYTNGMMPTTCFLFCVPFDLLSDEHWRLVLLC